MYLPFYIILSMNLANRFFLGYIYLANRLFLGYIYLANRLFLGCNDNIKEVGNLSSPGCSEINVRSLFNKRLAR
jgi:hypothetical protein